MKISRRKFIKNILISGISLYVFNKTSILKATPESPEKKLIILHTNDLHSQIEKIPANDIKNANTGGFARLSAIIKKIRQEEKNVLLLDAGDVFQGTPYFNMYKGEVEYKLMSYLGYDAATLGNHEFDNGIEELEKKINYANFPFVVSNYDFSETILNNKIKEYLIIQKDIFKIGIIGLGVNPEGLISKKNFDKIKYLDPLTKAKNLSDMLRHEKKCNLIICLSHLGFEQENNKPSDKLIAKNTENIDIIIGGHTHTIIDKPYFEDNLKGKKVLISQTGKSGKFLGKINCIFEKKSILFK